MTILIMLVMNSLQKYYRDIAVTMTGFSFIKLTAHIFRYIGQIKKRPNFKGFRILSSPNLRIKCIWIKIAGHWGGGPALQINHFYGVFLAVSGKYHYITI